MSSYAFGTDISENEADFEHIHVSQQAKSCRASGRYALWGKGMTVMVNDRTLIDEVSVCFVSGRLCGIMGPSGAGKSTLLNALMGRVRLTSGKTGINGSTITTKVKTHLINFVMAVDRLNEFLTVEETVYSAAKLRFPHSTSEEQKQKAEDVIKRMKLEECRNVLIGGTWCQGISKGQIKRVCVAQELLGDPIALILDEPTTGLDAVSAYELIAILKCVALERQIIVLLTLHQPNLRIIQQFDNVTLLRCGKIMYNGVSNYPIEFWDSLGDWSSLKIFKDSRKQFDISHHNILIDRQIQSAEKQPLDCDQQLAQAAASIAWKTQFQVSFWRSVTESRRNPLTLILVLLVNIVQAILLGAVFWKLQSDADKNVFGPYTKWRLWESPIFTYFNEGLDRYGHSGANRIDPLMQLLGHGINDSGRSFLFDFITGKERVQWFSDFVNCSRTHFPLENEFPPFPQWYWPEGTIKGKDAKLFVSDPSPLSTSSNFGVGTLSLEQFIGIVVSSIQMVDMISRAHTPWTGPQLEKYGPNMLLYWPAFAEAASKYASVFLCCAGNPYGLDYIDGSISGMAKPCSLLFPDVHFPTFPGLPDFDWSDSRIMLRRVLQNPDWIYAIVESFDNSSEYIESINLTTDTRSRRKLGSGLGGLVTNLYQLIFEKTDSPLRDLVQNLRSIVSKINSVDCLGNYCDITRTIVKAGDDVVSDIGNSVLTVLNICGTIFFLVGNLGFSSYDVLLQFPKQRAIFNHERANGLYRTSSYLLGKMTAEIPFNLIPAIVWATICWYMMGLENNSITILKYLGTAALISFTAYSMGYLTSAILLRLEPAIIASPLLLVSMFALAGFFLRENMMPYWIAWARHFSIYRHAYFAVSLIQFPVGGTYGSFPNSLVHVLAGVTEDRIWISIMNLIYISLACRIAAYLFVKYLHVKEGVEA